MVTLPPVPPVPPVPPIRTGTRLPATVVVAAVLGLIEAAVLLLGLASVLLTLGRWSLTRPGSLDSSTVVPVLLTAVLVPLVLAVVAVVGSVGVLQGRRRARVVLTVVGAVLVVLGVMSLVGALTGPGIVTPRLVLSLALALAVLVLLWVPASRSRSDLPPR